MRCPRAVRHPLHEDLAARAIAVTLQRHRVAAHAAVRVGDTQAVAGSAGGVVRAKVLPRRTPTHGAIGRQLARQQQHLGRRCTGLAGRRRFEDAGAQRLKSEHVIVVREPPIAWAAVTHHVARLQRITQGLRSAFGHEVRPDGARRIAHQAPGVRVLCGGRLRLRGRMAQAEVVPRFMNPGVAHTFGQSGIAMAVPPSSHATAKGTHAHATVRRPVDEAVVEGIGLILEVCTAGFAHRIHRFFEHVPVVRVVDFRIGLAQVDGCRTHGVRHATDGVTIKQLRSHTHRQWRRVAAIAVPNRYAHDLDGGRQLNHRLDHGGRCATRNRHRQRHAGLDEVCRHKGRVRQREVRAIRHAGRQRSRLGERHGQLQSALVVQHVQRGVWHRLAHRVGDVHLHEQGLVGHHLEQGVGNREDVRLHHVDGTHRRGSAGCRCR